MKNRKVSIVTDLDGRKIVFIHDILFKGKRKVDWKEVKNYLKNFVGKCYEIEENAEKIYLGGQLPIEYTGSDSRTAINGTAAKAKANAAQGIPELIQIASNPVWEENKKERHAEDAKYGWYRYDVRFALPVYDDAGEIMRYNIFHARLLVNHAANNRKYLYDILAIKKETSGPQQSV